MAWVIAVAVLGGLVATAFAKVCDLGMAWQKQLYHMAPWPTLALLPLGFALATWLTVRFAPAASGSGIPQVMAAAEERWTGGRWSGQRVTLRTAAFKFVVTFFLIVCGASIGREGPTVQVVAGVMRSLTRGLKGRIRMTVSQAVV